MEKLLTTVIVALMTGAAASLITALATLKGKKIDKVYQRLEDVEVQERDCREEVFDLRTELQSFYLITDILMESYPEADTRVRAIRERIQARKRQRASERAAEGDN